MTYPHRTVGPAPVLRAGAEISRPWTVTPNGRPTRAMPLTRRYETAWLSDSGEVHEATRVGPAMPAFESAFSAFARGTLIGTPAGQIAIEDLSPGTVISTREGPAPVRWIGRILLPPANLRQDGGAECYRVSADAFGQARPAHDVVLGSAARVAHRSGRLVGSRIGSEVLVPVGDFADGVMVTQITPVSAVACFHLALDRHAVIEANGMPLESFHPGREGAASLRGDLAALFVSFFPYLRDISGFGPPAMARIGLDRIEELTSI